ncbi:hypothetical protein [Spiroplasma sp. SV19]|uniref:hypothetical protein n=1 Tax=Spiroplasma sp. SV19 TaxID=2570468 RepID=UPI0024B742DD|nr:hypothetical protein [Spiroplasma sp. SV19]
MDFGHFEADLITGEYSKSFKLTITEKLTNLDYICHLDDKTANTINIKLTNFLRTQKLWNMLNH